jgi:hypothetical protein
LKERWRGGREKRRGRKRDGGEEGRREEKKIRRGWDQSIHKTIYKKRYRNGQRTLDNSF